MLTLNLSGRLWSDVYFRIVLMGSALIFERKSFAVQRASAFTSRERPRICAYPKRRKGSLAINHLNDREAASVQHADHFPIPQHEVNFRFYTEIPYSEARSEEPRPLRIT